jgi:tetratricopeptide (TPR) repeat protein
MQVSGPVLLRCDATLPYKTGMSIFKRILGVRSFSEYRKEADDCFSRGDYGTAKRRYDQALEQAGPEDKAQLEAVRERINACRDQIARAHIDKGMGLVKEKELDLALTEFNNAIEVATDPQVAERARQQIEAMERSEARENAEGSALSEEEKYVAIAGSWEEEQAEEYEAYGEDLRRALLALYEEHFEEARELLEKVATGAADPHYLYYEVGRARILTGETEKGVESLRQFLSSIGPDEGGETRLAAHVELARAADQAGDLEGAIAQLQTCIEVMPSDPRPYFLMGNFLRQHGLSQEAVDVLKSGLSAVDQTAPDLRTIQELGLAYRDLGSDREAIAWLERAIEQLTIRGQLDLPPEAAVSLAKLHEKSGNKGRAADLYVLLTNGSDRANFFGYYSEAGRLLSELKITGEARRMLQRALEFAPEDDAVRKAIAEQIHQLP